MQDASPDLSQAKTKADEAIFSSRLRPAIIGLIIVIAIGAAAYAYWEHATLYPSTDNAYVQANITQVAPLVTGVVTEVDAQEFKPVKSGDVLLRIDPAGFEAALKAAEARLALVQQQAGAAADNRRRQRQISLKLRPPLIRLASSSSTRQSNRPSMGSSEKCSSVPARSHGPA